MPSDEPLPDAAQAPGLAPGAPSPPFRSADQSPAEGALTPFQNDLLLLKYERLRTEVESRIAEIRRMLPLTALGSGAFWAWFAGKPEYIGNGPLHVIALWIPTVISTVMFAQYLAADQDLKKVGVFIGKIEIRLPSNVQWENEIGKHVWWLRIWQIVAMATLIGLNGVAGWSLRDQQLPPTEHRPVHGSSSESAAAQQAALTLAITRLTTASIDGEKCSADTRSQARATAESVKATALLVEGLSERVSQLSTDEKQAVAKAHARGAKR